MDKADYIAVGMQSMKLIESNLKIDCDESFPCDYRKEVEIPASVDVSKPVVNRKAKWCVLCNQEIIDETKLIPCRLELAFKAWERAWAILFDRKGEIPINLDIPEHLEGKCMLCHKPFKKTDDKRRVCPACITAELKAWDIIPENLTIDELRFNEPVVDKPEFKEAEGGLLPFDEQKSEKEAWDTVGNGTGEDQ